MTISIESLKLRLLDQCYKHNKHHLGSAFSTLPILKEIYDSKTKSDRVVLSNGHAAAALYICLEAYLGHSSDELFRTMGDHPKRNKQYDVDCSTGSLGMGLTVAVGMALANPDTKVYCIVSDGECAEGSIWESLRYAESANLTNLEVFFNINGYAAYDKIDSERLGREILTIYPRAKLRFMNMHPFDSYELSAHYIKIDERTYQNLREQL